jgi:hypothetical protein
MERVMENTVTEATKKTAPEGSFWENLQKNMELIKNLLISIGILTSLGSMYV